MTGDWRFPPVLWPLGAPGKDALRSGEANPRGSIAISLKENSGVTGRPDRIGDVEAASPPQGSRFSRPAHRGPAERRKAANSGAPPAGRAGPARFGIGVSWSRPVIALLALAAGRRAALYLKVGIAGPCPARPLGPLAGWADDPEPIGSTALVVQVEAHLEANPEDARRAGR